jgi:hypothetical protein
MSYQNSSGGYHSLVIIHWKLGAQERHVGLTASILPLGPYPCLHLLILNILIC